MAIVLNVSTSDNFFQLMDLMRAWQRPTAPKFIELTLSNSSSLSDFLASTPGFSAALGCSVNGVLVLPYLAPTYSTYELLFGSEAMDSLRRFARAGGIVVVTTTQGSSNPTVWALGACAARGWCNTAVMQQFASSPAVLMINQLAGAPVCATQSPAKLQGGERMPVAKAGSAAFPEIGLVDWTSGKVSDLVNTCDNPDRGRCINATFDLSLSCSSGYPLISAPAGSDAEPIVRSLVHLLRAGEGFIVYFGVDLTWRDSNGNTTLSVVLPLVWQHLTQAGGRTFPDPLDMEPGKRQPRCFRVTVLPPPTS